MNYPDLPYRYMLHGDQKGGLHLTRHSGYAQSGDTSLVVPSSMGVTPTKIGLEALDLLTHVEGDQVLSDRRYLLLPGLKGVGFQRSEKGSLLFREGEKPYPEALALRGTVSERVSRIFTRDPYGQMIKLIVD